VRVSVVVAVPRSVVVAVTVCVRLGDDSVTSRSVGAVDSVFGSAVVDVSTDPVSGLLSPTLLYAVTA
jgi:hypothetical protein